MLRRSFVPPQAVRDLRALTRTRARLARDQARHRARVEKILEDALLKISVVISDLFGASGRRFLDALVAGQRSPAGLAALGDPRLKATRRQLEEALTGQFRDIHAFEIKTHLRILDVINEEIARLDEAIGEQLALVPRTAPACTACGGEGTPLLSLAERLDEITGVGLINARVLIAELGTDPSQFPTPGHAAAWARLTPRSLQSGQSASPGRTVTVARVLCEIAWILICDPGARFEELGPDYYTPRSPERQTRDKIRELSRLNPGMKVLLVPAEDPGPHAATAA